MMKMITGEVLTISKTNDLRKLVQTQLKSITANVHYKNADEGTLYPHIVHVVERTNKIVEHRDDVSVVIDVWTKSATEAVELADSVERILDRENLPQDTILPTFFLESKIDVKDEDKSISHIQLTFNVQNYER